MAQPFRAPRPLPTELASAFTALLRRVVGPAVQYPASMAHSHVFGHAINAARCMALTAVALRSVIFSGVGGPVLQEVASVAQADLSSRAAIATRGVALRAVETTPVGRFPMFSPAALAKELVF